MILLDSDGQHLPEEIPVLLKPLEEGRADLVSGSRMLGTLRTSRINVIGNWGLRMLSLLGHLEMALRHGDGLPGFSGGGAVRHPA